jgi:2-phospho-L-lactate guanylyltransferase (CobY/MobA/RfbA family)
VQLGLSLQASLSDPEKREAIYAMLRALADAVDSDKIAHIQVTARATVSESASTEIIAKAERAGANPNSTPI